MPVPVLAAARRRVVRRLEAGNAVSRETAVSLAGLSRIEHGRLARLIEVGAVHEAAPGTYWLDVPHYAVYAQRHRRIMFLVVLAIIVALFFVVELSGRS